MILREISKWTKNFFIFYFWISLFCRQISRRVSYFVDILHGVGDIILLGCLQVLSLSNLGSRGNSEIHKNPIQSKERDSFIYIGKTQRKFN